MRQIRYVVDGKLVCSRCRAAKLTDHFKRESRNPCGYASACKSCLKAEPKRPSVEIEAKKCLLSVAREEHAKYAPPGDALTRRGDWERVIANALLLAPEECLKIGARNDFYTRERMLAGVRSAARRMKVKVRIDQGASAIFVRAQRRGFRASGVEVTQQSPLG